MRTDRQMDRPTDRTENITLTANGGSKIDISNITIIESVWKLPLSYKNKSMKDNLTRIFFFSHKTGNSISLQKLTALMFQMNPSMQLYIIYWSMWNVHVVLVDCKKVESKYFKLKADRPQRYPHMPMMTDRQIPLHMTSTGNGPYFLQTWGQLPFVALDLTLDLDLPFTFRPLRGHPEVSTFSLMR